MRCFIIIILSIFIFSCSENKSSTEENTVEKSVSTSKIEQQQTVEKETKDEEYNYYVKDTLIRNPITRLENQYGKGRIPYYVRISGSPFFIIETKNKYFGIALDSSKVILEPIYQKIYHPNVTLRDCFEIKEHDKIGLYNYKTNKILTPQFDYIIPDKDSDFTIAYGRKGTEWFRIQKTNIQEFSKVEIDVMSKLSNTVYDIEFVGNNIFENSYLEFYEEDPIEGGGYMILPSYMDFISKGKNKYFSEVIIKEISNTNFFGTEKAGFEIKNEKTVLNNLSSFFVDIYESGVDARGYASNDINFISYNEENNELVESTLGKESFSSDLCADFDYQILNDSIIQVRKGGHFYDNKGTSFYTKYDFFKIQPSGSLEELVTNRKFNFTKFIYIDPSYFKGCFAWSVIGAEHGYENMWKTDHLSIEDLDIMRNEIYADYGYKFKSKKWQDYFGRKSWYIPKYENVDDQLTDFDKENIKVILKVKEEMKGNEQEFTNKRKINWTAAG